jgi:phage terminase large subunit-like protein
MPWQQQVADLALEVDEGTGRFAYREVYVTIPRQSGKTTLVLPVATLRAQISQHLGGRQRMLYAAQTRTDARDKWEEDFVEDLKAAPKMRGRFRVSLASGREHVRYRDGSTFGPISTTEKAGHGKTLDLGLADELFAQVDDRIEQAWRPAMITRGQAQYWGLSTAGTDTSLYLLTKVKAGRRLVEAGADSGVAYIEYAAEPDADPADPAVWRSCMPALGFTVTEDAIRAEYVSLEAAGNLNLFRRAYLNQWVDRDAGEQVIPAQAWAACRDEDSELVGEPAFAIDITPASTWAAIVCAGWRADGLQHLELIDHRPGTDWFVARVAEVTRRWSSLPVAYDPAGPVASLASELEAAGVVLAPMSSRALVAGCEGLFRDVVAGSVRHIGQPALDAAVSAGRKRELGDGWAWRRKTSSGDISPLVAMTEARANLLEHPQITTANVYVV